MNQPPLELMRRSRVSRRIRYCVWLFALGLGLSDSAFSQFICNSERRYAISWFGTGVFPLTNGDYAQDTLNSCPQQVTFEIPYIWIIGSGPIIQHLGVNSLPICGQEGGGQILVYTAANFGSPYGVLSCDHSSTEKHETGHAVGLEHSSGAGTSCNGTLMVGNPYAIIGGNPVWIVGNTANTSECTAVDQMYTTIHEWNYWYPPP